MTHIAREDEGLADGKKVPGVRRCDTSYLATRMEKRSCVYMEDEKVITPFYPWLVGTTAMGDKSYLCHRGNNYKKLFGRRQNSRQVHSGWVRGKSPVISNSTYTSIRIDDPTGDMFFEHCEKLPVEARKNVRTCHCSWELTLTTFM